MTDAARSARATSRRKPSQGHLDRKKLMQRMKANSNTGVDDGPMSVINEASLFKHACSSGAAEVVNNLLAAASEAMRDSLRSNTNDAGETAVHIACSVGNTGVVAVLCAYDFSLTAKDQEGRNPMHSLVYSDALSKSEALFKLLLHHEISILFEGDNTMKCPLEILGEKNEGRLLEITTDYLSCLAVNRTSPKEADEQSLARDRGRAALMKDPAAVQEKSEEQRQKERLDARRRRGHALESLWKLEFNDLPPAVKRVLVHAAVPIGWLFMIGGCHMPPPSDNGMRSSNADTAPGQEGLLNGGSDGEEDLPEGRQLKRSRKGTIGKSTLKQLLGDTASGQGEERGSDSSKSRRGSKKPDLLCRLDLREAGLLWLPAGKEFWRSVAAVMEVDVKRNCLEFIPSVCASPVLPFLKVMYVGGNPLGFLLEELVGTLSTSARDNAPTPKKTWSAIVKQLTHASKRASSWDVHKLVLVGPSGPIRKSLLKLFLGEETDRLDKLDVVIECEKRMQLAKRKKKKEQRHRFSYIDLGDNEAIRSTWKVFLSKQMIYMVAFDALKATQQLGEIDFFMHQVRLYSSGVTAQHKTVLVGTVTAESASSCTKEYWSTVVNTMEQRFPKGRGRGFERILLVNLDSKQHLTELQQYLDSLAADFETARPVEYTSRTEWRLVNTEIKKLRETAEYWDWPSFQALASKFGICQASEQTELILFLQKVGTITFLVEEIDTRSFKNHDLLIILHPQRWALKLISFSHVSRLTGGGKAYLVQKDLLLEEMELDSTANSKVLRFLETVGLAYPMTEPSDMLFIPSNLHNPKGQSKDSGWQQGLPKAFVEHRRIYRFQSIPVAFLDRLALMVMHTPSLKVTRVLKNHLSLTSSLSGEDSLEQEAMVYYRAKSSSQSTYDVHVAVRMPEEKFQGIVGSSKDRLLMSELVYLVEMILSNFYSSIMSTMTRVIPCSHCLSNDQFKDDPHIFSIEEVVSALLNGQKVAYCRDIQSQSRTVRISCLAPDLTLKGVPSIPASRLRMGEELGKGAFGTVHQAEYHGKKVAVKELSFAGMDFVTEELRQEKQVAVCVEFQREVHLMTHLESNFIVNLLGIEDESLKMVLEFVPNGTLHELVRMKNSDPPPAPAFVPAVDVVPWDLRRRIALDIARGMQAMSTAVPPVVHRDLRSPNIFLQSLDVKAPVVAKVADFGLSTMAPGNRAAGMLHSWRWLAPEVIDHVGLRQYGWQSDVYSFGVVLWELCCGLFPFGDYTEGLGWDEWDVKQAILHHGLRPTIPENCPADIAEMMRLCWMTEPTQRPSFTELVERLSPNATSALPEVVRTPSLGRVVELDIRQSKESVKPRSLLSPRESTVLPLEAASILVVGNRVFLGGSEGTVVVLESGAGDKEQSSLFETNRWKAHSKKVTSMCVAGPFKHRGVLTKSGTPAAATLIWTASSDGGVRVWSGDTLDLEFAFSYSSMVPAILTVPKDDSSCEVWVVIPVDRKISIYSVTSANDVELTKTLTLTTEKGAKAPTPSCIELGGDGMVLVGAEQLIFVLDSESHAILCYFQAHERNWLRGMHKVSGTQLLWTYLVRSSMMNVWKVQREPFEVQMVEEVAMHHGKVTAIASTSPSQTTGSLQGTAGRHLVFSSSVHYNVLVWDVKLGQAVDEIQLDASQKEIATCMARLGKLLIVGTSVTRPDGELGGRVRTFELL